MKCKQCGEDVEELHAVRVRGRARRVCEECVERLEEEAEIEDGALGAMRDMMGYKGGSLPADFLHCVKTRERPFRDVEFAHRAATVCHLGNIAYWTKRRLKFDPEAERFVNDKAADRWLDRAKRDPWRI